MSNANNQTRLQYLEDKIKDLEQRLCHNSESEDDDDDDRTSTTVTPPSRRSSSSGPRGGGGRSEQQRRPPVRGARTSPLIRRVSKKVPWTAQEKRTVLIAVNTVGLGRWKMILTTYSQLFAINRRSNVDIKDVYRTMVNQGLARREGPTATHDCYTDRAKRKFSLRTGQQDPALL